MREGTHLQVCVGVTLKKNMSKKRCAPLILALLLGVCDIVASITSACGADTMFPPVWDHYIDVYFPESCFNHNRSPKM